MVKLMRNHQRKLGTPFSNKPICSCAVTLPTLERGLGKIKGPDNPSSQALPIIRKSG